eukprot:983480-Rhodomonas_salina.4
MSFRKVPTFVPGKFRYLYQPCGVWSGKFRRLYQPCWDPEELLRGKSSLELDGDFSLAEHTQPRVE